MDGPGVFIRAPSDWPSLVGRAISVPEDQLDRLYTFHFDSALDEYDIYRLVPEFAAEGTDAAVAALTDGSLAGGEGDGGSLLPPYADQRPLHLCGR